MTGDHARVSVAVAVDAATAFAVFTQDIDVWWRRGARFRNAGSRRGIVCIEPRVGGRLFESIEGPASQHVVELGRVDVWDPPQRLAFSWRASNFAPHESTRVEVEFTPQRAGTLVTLTHSGFAALRDDHPVRHGLVGSAFCAEMGRWWGDQMASLRESAMLAGRTNEMDAYRAMADPTPIPQDENQIIAERRAKLAALRAQGQAFPNDFRRDALAADLHGKHGGETNEALEAAAIPVNVAGRMMLKRVMGKACFATLQDMSGRIQLYVTIDGVGAETLEAFKHWDLGDIVAASGTLFKTRTGELSVKATSVRLLTKSLRPLPEKFHGMTDTEQRYRQRYVDLITNPQARDVFVKRSQIVQCIREFFVARGYLEVETPMMHPIPGGAAARPFATHHNALDMELFLRIAPELYLKRLVVGGLEKVFEINRNFRNEGISTRHNPEFTMLEFYEAYRDYHYLMDLTEELIRETATRVLGTTSIVYQGNEIDLARPFDRLTMAAAIHQYNPEHPPEGLANPDYLRNALARYEVEVFPTDGLGLLQLKLFEETTESKLVQPTFIVAHPTDVSPLARANEANPAVTDRFELFMTGREFANGFSELNDSEDQAARFQAQVDAREAGDEEAMFYDADYIRAMEYGLPPTAGEGIGIDRLVMLLTDSPSIRDVILFPQLKKE